MLTRATIVVTACLSLLLGGCYETDKPIITRDIAVELPGLEGDILFLEGDTLDFSFDEQSMSYQAGERQTDGSIEWMPCAIMPFRRPVERSVDRQEHQRCANGGGSHGGRGHGVRGRGRTD